MRWLHSSQHNLPPEDCDGCARTRSSQTASFCYQIGMSGTPRTASGEIYWISAIPERACLCRQEVRTHTSIHLITRNLSSCLQAHRYSLIEQKGKNSTINHNAGRLPCFSMTEKNERRMFFPCKLTGKFAWFFSFKKGKIGVCREESDQAVQIYCTSASGHTSNAHVYFRRWWKCRTGAFGVKRLTMNWWALRPLFPPISQGRHIHPPPPPIFTLLHPSWDPPHQHADRTELISGYAENAKQHRS